MSPRDRTGPAQRTLAAVSLCALFAVACERDMSDQPRYDALEPSPAFEDGLSARPRVAHAVARGELDQDELLYRGTQDSRLSTQFPFAIGARELRRGQQRFDIYCSPCHGELGDGDGMIVQRGFSPPPSFHVDRLRNAPAGYLFDVIGSGYGAMYGYAEDIAPADRWHIVAYIRALQLSQHTLLADLPPALRTQLQGAAP